MSDAFELAITYSIAAPPAIVMPGRDGEMEGAAAVQRAKVAERRVHG